MPDYPNATRDEIIQHLDHLKSKHEDLLKQGTQANMSDGEWRKYTTALRNSAGMAKCEKTTTRVPTLRKVGKVEKVVGVITFAYNALDGGVTVAAEGFADDALFPYLDIAKAAGNSLGCCTDELFRGGKLNQQLLGETLEEVLGEPLNDDGTITGKKGGYSSGWWW